MDGLRVNQALGAVCVFFGARKNDLTLRLFSQNNRNTASTASDPIITCSMIPPRKK